MFMAVSLWTLQGMQMRETSGAVSSWGYDVQKSKYQVDDKQQSTSDLY
jgi:hypothetical protein